MKLIYIHQYFKFPDTRGAVRSYDLSKVFLENGIEVVVIATTNTKSKKRWEYSEREGIKLYQLSCAYDNSMGFIQRIFSFFKFMFFATIKILQLKCDIVLATSTPLSVAFPALVKKAIQKTPYIIETRDVWPEVPIKMGFIKNKLLVAFLYWFEKITYNNSDWIVPLSTGMEENIKQRYRGTNITVIPNISNIDRFQNSAKDININLPIIDGKKVVLYAGTLGTVNGIQYIVDLAKETSKLDVNIIYLVVGTGREKEKLIKYAEQSNLLNKSIYFIDAVSKDSLSYLYAKCTLGSSFVINNPVLWDNSANKFFDTLAASKPILINHEGWQADTIRKYNIGYILAPIVNQNSAKAFVSYINDEELLQEQGKNAFKVGKCEYSLEVAARKYLFIIHSTLKTNV